MIGSGIVHNLKKNKEISDEDQACRNKIIKFENKNITSTIFPFVTTHAELERYILISTWFQPTLNYVSKYNKDKFDSPVYKNLDTHSIHNTTKYIFDKMKMGVFVRIYNNILVNFIPLYNVEYKNDFSDKLKFKEGNVGKYFEHKKEFFKFVPKTTYDMKKWFASNCTLSHEDQDRYPVQNYMYQFYDMLIETLHNRKVNDCIFFWNRKDFPILGNNYNEAFDEIFGDKKMEKPWRDYSYIPILSQSTTDKHADIPVPCADDWDIITQKYMPYKIDKQGGRCMNDYILKDLDIVKWEDRKPVVIWRGTGTGCGNSIENNPRLKVTKMSEELEEKGYLDAGIVEHTDRDKITQDNPYVHFYVNDQKLKYKGFMSLQDQMTHKFILNIEGNSSAYRFSSLFRLGFCVLNVESKYKLWFEPFLEEGVHYIGIKHDLSNLVEKIEWCLEHDDECKQIAINGANFFMKYINKNFVYDYLSDVLNKVSSLYVKYDPKVELYDYKTLKMAKHNYTKRYTVPYIYIDKDTKKPGNKEDMVIIVCFRDQPEQHRMKQLEKFLDHYKDYNIIISEQSMDGRKFNRGATLNIGFDYVKDKYKSFVFHDVDLLLEYDKVDKYYCDTEYDIIHLGRLIKDYYSSYQNFLGGIIKFSKECFETINGFPNCFYGWGSEDTALSHRLIQSGYKVAITNETPEGLEMKHVKTNTIPALTNLLKYESLLVDEFIWKISGLRELQYKILDTVQVQEHATKITVDIS